jgi:hypothetical protein
MVAGPDIDQAEFEFKYGLYADNEVVQPLDLNRHYIRVAMRDVDSEPTGSDISILATAFHIWYGVIEVDEKDIFGTRVFDFRNTQTTVKTGNQKITAFGLLRELENTPVNQSIVKQAASAQNQEIPRGIPFNFNENGQFPDRGNRSENEEGVEATYVFSFEPNGDFKWNGADALNYTIKNDVPLDSQGNKAYRWNFTTGGSLEWFDVTVKRDKRSVKDVVDDIVDRRRAVGYYVQGDEQGASFESIVRVFTFLESSIPLNDNITILPNPRQFTLDFESSFDVTEALLVNSITHKADVITVRGAKVTSTFSIWVDPTLLEGGWTSANETAYLEGALNTAGYAALEEDDQKEVNQRARTQDSLGDVFSKFVMVDIWDLQISDSKSPGATNYWIAVAPGDFQSLPADPDDLTGDFSVDLNPDGSFVNPPDKLWSKGAKFERFLSIKKDSADELSEYKDPLVIFQTDTDAGVWEFGEQLNSRSGMEHEQSRKFSTRLNMLDKELGIEVIVGAAGAQQLIALENWAGAEPTPANYDPETEEGNGVDYFEMIATVSMKWDRHVEAVVFPRGTPLNSLEPGVPKRETFIDVPDARLDYLIPGTVTDIDDAGALVVDTTGSILRDDRDRMKRIASLAEIWYGVTRQALTLTYKQLRAVANEDGSIRLRIGDLITSIGAQYSETDVNSVVTGITFDNGESPTTTIQLSYAHLDFADAI